MSALDLSRLRYSDQPILNGEEVVGWHVFLRDELNGFLSGGTHSNRDVARRIATSEFIERRTFLEICNASKKDVEDFGINEFPSTCGFACGFDDKKTLFRSICEGIERWGVSQWIDSRYYIGAAPPDEVIISPLGKVLLSKFSSHHFFKKKIVVEPVLISSTGHLKSLMTFLNIFLGETEHGIFFGARVTMSENTPWEHEIVEAYRNYENFQLIEKGLLKPDENDIYLKRVHYFGQNRAQAWNQIPKDGHLPWPKPELLISKKAEIGIEGIFVWRTLFKGYVHWGSGPLERFVI